jgi:hypothetical protein
MAILLLSLGGRAGTEFEPVKRTDAPDSLTVRSAVTDEFRNAKLTGNAYVSELRDWMVCFKSDGPDQAVRYAMFFRNDKAVTARPAAVIDGCNRATYTPLEPLDVEGLPTLPKWILRTVEKGEVERAIKYCDYLNET